MPQNREANMRETGHEPNELPVAKVSGQRQTPLAIARRNAEELKEEFTRILKSSETT
jgi:hypothetical protein